MKKGLLKALSAVVAISMLFCMSMVAFADGLTTTAVVTTYDGANVTVKTDVIGANGSEQVAFLVEKEIAGETTTIWIDQQTAKADGTASSTFTAAADAAVGATVRVGTSSIAASAGSEDEIEWGSYNVTWTVTGTNPENPSRVVAYVGEGEGNTGASAAVGQNVGQITFYFFPAANETLSTINNVEATEIGNAVSYPITRDAHYDFVFTTKTIAEDTDPVANVNPDVAVTKYNGTYASVPAKAENATEYGILVALDEDELTEAAIATAPVGGTADANGASIIKLPALGSNAEGLFVIQINDEAGQFFTTGSKYWAAVYIVNDNGADLTTAFELN